ncbi:MAG: cadherin-like beta sandwich domain-containing protein [Verrucomicrobiota bacterium]
MNLNPKRFITLIWSGLMLSALPLRGEVVVASYHSATDVPVTSANYTATGNSVDISLNFAPAVGTSLTVVNNTGTDAIHGTFDNLGQWQAVNLTSGGVVYRFVANYFGGTGNDLVLQWGSNRLVAWGANTYGVLGSFITESCNVPVPVDMSGTPADKIIVANASGGAHRIALCSDGFLAAWGFNKYGQLGNNSTSSSSVPAWVDRSGVLVGKTVIAIAAGNVHSLALCADGTLAAWGSNSYGQLGNHSTFNSSVPVLVDQTGILADKTVIAIAAGSTTSFALCADGTVASWGDNTNGRLGNNSTNHSSAPVWVDRSGVLAGKSVVALDAGEYFTLVLCQDGTLATWGDNNYNQLGNNNTINSGVPVLVNQTGVLAGKTPVAISAGDRHAMVLCSDGKMAAWGNNSSGQLGNNTMISSGVPVAVTQTGALSGKTVVAIATGGYHSLALCADGYLAAWGDNSTGALGVGNTTSRSTPAAVYQSGLVTGESITTVNGGSAYSLAMVAMPPPPAATSLAATTVLDTSAIIRGSVNANGTSTAISFEYGLTTSYGASVSATSASASGTVTTAANAALNSLRSGTTYHYRIVAVSTGGTVKGADMTFTTSTLATLSSLMLNGATLHPAFSNLTTSYATTVPFATTSLTMTPVVAHPGASVSVAGVTVMTGATTAPLALTTGANRIDVVVTAAGGGNTQTYSVMVTRLPQTFTFNSATDVPVTADGFVATGNAPPLILNYTPVPGTRLTVVNNTGQGLIAGTFANLAQGQRVQLTYAGITYIFVANYFGGTGNDLVLQWANTRLLDWGYNNYGQLGNNSTTYSRLAVPVDMSGVLAGKTVVGTATGNYHSLALRSDGTLVSWGYNNYGQLGNNSIIDSSAPVLVDQSGVLAGKTIAVIAAGASHNLALCTDGTLVSWGYNSSGQLGNNTTTNAMVPVAVDLTGVLADKTIVVIAAGGTHSLVLCSDGTLAAWGSNAYGQLGSNVPQAYSSVPVVVTLTGVLAGRTVAAIAAGGSHSLALCTDGTLVSWGHNTYGQLGNNSTTTSRIPVLVCRALNN